MILFFSHAWIRSIHVEVWLLEKIFKLQCICADVDVCPMHSPSVCALEEHQHVLHCSDVTWLIKIHDISQKVLLYKFWLRSIYCNSIMLKTIMCRYNWEIKWVIKKYRHSRNNKYINSRKSSINNDNINNNNNKSSRNNNNIISNKRKSSRNNNNNINNSKRSSILRGFS